MNSLLKVSVENDDDDDDDGDDDDDDDDDDDEPPAKLLKLTSPRRSNRNANLACIMPRLCVICGSSTKRYTRNGKRGYDKLVTTQQLDAGTLHQISHLIYFILYLKCVHCYNF